VETLIRNAKIMDGTGNPWFRGDVALANGRITAVAPRLPVKQARHVVDADGLVLAPGFIDIMSHSILPLMRDGVSLSKLAQGVTTEIMGESWTPAPFGGKRATPPTWGMNGLDLDEWETRAKSWTRFSDWLEAIVKRGVAVNIGSFLGGGTLREYVRGYELDPSSESELQTMRHVMRSAMQDGAFGVAYALIYPPDVYADTNEIIEVCKVVGEHGGLYISHLRSETEQLEEALEEALRIGREANVPVQIYHLKAEGKTNYEKMPRVLERIRAARASGQDVTADMYPYPASQTTLSAALPPWLAEGGKLFERLCDPEIRAEVREELTHPTGDWEACANIAGAENTHPVDFLRQEHQSYIGKSLAEIAALRNQDWIDTIMDLLVAEGQGIQTFYFDIDESNIAKQLLEPWVMVSSDEGGYDPAWAKVTFPHPRAYGTFPKVLGYYSREKKLLGLEEAVRKMTSLPASRLGLTDRGLIRPGFCADLVLFDPETIKDTATFTQPHQLAQGIHSVWVNGVSVFHNGQHTGAFPGQAVYGPGKNKGVKP
jgi:N-acyl-D-aspartate/D-glutamate deacylase